MKALFKERMRRTFIAVFLFALLASAIAAPVHAQAAKLKIGKTYYQDVTSYSKKNFTSVASVFDISDSVARVISLKSSKPSVIKIKQDLYGQWWLSPQKAGKSKITFTVQYNATGKKQTFTTTIMAQKWTNPLKTLKIGSTSFQKKFAKTSFIQYSSSKTLSGKLVVKPSSGWQLVSIKKNNSSTLKTSTLKNNKTYQINPERESILITLKEKKTGFLRICTINSLC